MTKKAKKIEVVSRASVNGFRMSPQKARLVVDLVRGKQVEQAQQILMFMPKKAAVITLKALNSALANAKDLKNVDIDKLWVTGAFVGEGITLKRFMPRAQGRATPIMKKSSHITIELGQR